MSVIQAFRRRTTELFVGSIALAAWPSLATSASTSGVDCTIRAERQNGLLVLSAVAVSGSAASGRYTLVLSKRSDSGTSQTIQEGSFNLRPGSPDILATTAVEAAAEGHLQASLVLETDQGIIRCAFPG